MVFFFVAAIAIVFFLEKNASKEKTVMPEVLSEQEQIKENDQNNRENKADNILYFNNLSLEILSCEKIEDTEIETQTTYPAEWFYSGELPDGEYLVEYKDYEAIEKASPELKDLWENEGHTPEETEEIYNRNLDVIEQYTTMRHPKTRYYFAKCRITNLLDRENEVCVAPEVFISDQSEFLWPQEDNCYFDKAVHTATEEERTHQFFWYPFKKGEVLECVLGFEIREKWNEDETYYLGHQTAIEGGYTFENTEVIPLMGTDGTNE